MSDGLAKDDAPVFIELTIQERMAVSKFLPENGDYATIGYCISLSQKVAILDKEHEEINMRRVLAGQDKEGNPLYYFEWNEPEPLKVSLSQGEVNMLRARYKQLDSEKKIDASIFPLVKKIREVTRT